MLILFVMSCLHVLDVSGLSNKSMVPLGGVPAILSVIDIVVQAEWAAKL